MTLQGLSVVQGFLSGIFESLSVSQGVGQYTRLGIVGFAANATVFNYLTDINSTDQALSAIRAIQYDGGDQVNLIPAFQTVQEVISTSDKRPNVKNLILIVTTACTDDPTPIAHQLKALDNVIVTLAYGQVDETPPPILTFASSGFNFTNKDVNLTQEILAAFCDSNCFCPSPRWRQFIDSTSKKYGECLYQGDIPTTWLEAQLTCESKLGYLMDELSSEKHYFVKKLAIAENIQPLAYWIGLTNKNGIWGWDRGINSTLPLTSNDYTNWAAGNPTDANNCTGEVQTLGFNVQWKTMACTTTLASDFRVYFCQ
uniref:C-type lectin domain-containing protein n=1 Tax=Plectus sambesii TaxID=2011161 RepID=A0A914V8Y0_9BILA